MHFFYDAQSRPAMVEFNGALYSYVHNLQGDIVGIVDSAGSLVVEYKYDAWGKPTLVRTLTTAYEALAELNPFRYRGYVYDEETELYYLRSRYYHNVISRFIGVDPVLGISEGIFGTNSFVYCLNDPLNRVDRWGTEPYRWYENKMDALRDAALYIGDVSFKNGWEYVTYIYQVDVTVYSYKTKVIFNGNFPFIHIVSGYFPETKTYYYYTVYYTTKEYDNVTIDPAKLTDESIGIVHTHPWGSGMGVTELSIDDRTIALLYEVPVYVYGPDGKMEMYDIVNEKDVLVFDDLPISTNPIWRE